MVHVFMLPGALLCCGATQGFLFDIAVGRIAVA